MSSTNSVSYQCFFFFFFTVVQVQLTPFSPHPPINVSKSFIFCLCIKSIMVESNNYICIQNNTPEYHNWVCF